MHVDWKYGAIATTTNGSSNPEEEGPKFEDFLGGYSEHTNEESPNLQQPISHFHAMYPGINVNMPPSIIPAAEGRTEEDVHDPYHYIQSFHPFQDPTTLRPSPLATDPIYSVGTDGSISISGMKSWLRQNQYAPEKQPADGVRSLSLSMSPGLGLQSVPHELAPAEAADDPSRLNAKSAARETVPRKSIETFGQRTSQYRGVTRWVSVKTRWCGFLDSSSLLCLLLMNAAGIGGREGMKPTCGITAAERKARRGKEGKVATPFPSNPSRMLSL